MRKLMVPIMFSNLTYENRDAYLSTLMATKTDRVFIAVDRALFFVQDKTLLTENLENHLRFFESHGLEAGAWMQAFGFGNSLTAREAELTKNMTRIESVDGKVCGDAFCPEDPQFMNWYSEMLTAVAKAKPSMIMLDDDLCLSVRPGVGCFCHRHMKMLEQRLSRPLRRENLAQELFAGKATPERKIWLDMMGDTLRAFCHKVRQIVDQVDPDIRVGFCAGFTSWDLEGADAAELSHILAGKNAPFLRFTGAPYWVAPHWNRFKGQRLHGVIEFAREQEAWCKDSGIECFSEADSYPRPRYHIPGNLLECFDAAMIASGDTGDLKYFFDYFSNPAYETGYARLHKKNSKLHSFLEENFWGKEPMGIRVYEKMRKLADMELPAKCAESDVMSTALPVAGAVLTQLGIPVHYEDNHSACAIAFGENVMAVQELPEYFILDMKAALILQNQGVDVGIKTAHLMEAGMTPSVEVSDNEKISLTHQSGRYYRSELKDEAQVCSYYQRGNEQFPAAYTYSSGKTKYLVFTIDAGSFNQSSGVFCSYLRQQQILDFYTDFPVIRNSPFAYQLCKRDEKETVAFFANIFEDEMWDFDIELDREYQQVESYGADVELCGDRLRVTSTVPAYGMFALKLK